MTFSKTLPAELFLYIRSFKAEFRRNSVRLVTMCTFSIIYIHVNPSHITCSLQSISKFAKGLNSITNFFSQYFSVWNRGGKLAMPRSAGLYILYSSQSLMPNLDFMKSRQKKGVSTYTDSFLHRLGQTQINSVRLRQTRELTHKLASVMAMKGKRSKHSLGVCFLCSLQPFRSKLHSGSQSQIFK